MKYNTEKVDEFALALLFLSTFKKEPAVQVWKGFAWEILDRLHDKGLISDPKGKAKSVVMSEMGAKLSKEFFERHFC